MRWSQGTLLKVKLKLHELPVYRACRQCEWEQSDRPEQTVCDGIFTCITNWNDNLFKNRFWKSSGDVENDLWHSVNYVGGGAIGLVSVRKAFTLR